MFEKAIDNFKYFGYCFYTEVLLTGFDLWNMDINCRLR